MTKYILFGVAQNHDLKIGDSLLKKGAFNVFFFFKVNAKIQNKQIT